MKFLSKRWILNMLTVKNPKKIFPEAKHVIERAFTVGGKDYYQFPDPFNAPYQRALTSIVFFREVSMNCDYAFLETHCEAVHKLLTSNPIDIFQIKKLNDLLLQRVKMPKDAELMYKLASVVFFDKSENPEVYDVKYCEKKIEFWKNNSKAEDFFLQQPIVTLIPYLKFAGENLNTYSLMVGSMNKIHSETVSGILSES